MDKQERTIRITAIIGLVFCLLVLSKYILFKKSPFYYKNYFAHEYNHYTVKAGWKEANLRPFHTIRLFSSRYVTSAYSYENIGGNVVGFIPLGILLPLVFPFLSKWWRLALFVFGVSLLFELTQLFTGVGIFDVDDLMLNTLGGVIGFFLYAGGKYLLTKEVY